MLSYFKPKFPLLQINQKPPNLSQKIAPYLTSVKYHPLDFYQLKNGSLNFQLPTCIRLNERKMRRLCFFFFFQIQIDDIFCPVRSPMGDAKMTMPFQFWHHHKFSNAKVKMALPILTYPLQWKTIFGNSIGCCAKSYRYHFQRCYLALYWISNAKIWHHLCHCRCFQRQNNYYQKSNKDSRPLTNPIN